MLIVCCSTEKAPGMFATLVIALPSEHTGGDVRVSLRGEQKTLKTEAVTDFDCAFLAWYADVNHSIEEVKSGHRLVLTYNLVYTTEDSSCKASHLDDHKRNFDDVLSSWGRDRENDDLEPWHAVYMLEHRYSEANICLEYLKGIDQTRVQYLVASCKDQGFCIYLAHFERAKSGGCDSDEDDTGYHHMIDEVESEHKLTQVFNLDGQCLAEDVSIDEEEVVQQAFFESAEPDDEDYSGWTGNEGTNATHFYRRSCVVLLLRCDRFAFFEKTAFNGKVNVALWTNTLIEEMKVDSLRGKAKAEFEQLCELAVRFKVISKDKRKEKKWDGARPWAYSPAYHNDDHLGCVSDEDLGALVEGILWLKNPDLLEKVASSVTEVFEEGVYKDLGEAIAFFDADMWRDR